LALSHGSRADLEGDVLKLAGSEESFSLDLTWASYLGGSSFDNIRDMKTGGDGTITVTGETLSLDFPVTPGPLDDPNGNLDVFVSRIDPKTSSALFSARVGGSDEDEATCLALGAGGDAFVAGRTVSVDFPVSAGAYDTTSSANLGRDEAFAFRLRANGNSLVYSTFLGGSQDDWAKDIVVTSSGEAIVVGLSKSVNYPVTPGAFQTSAPDLGNDDGFITRLTADGSSAVYSGYIGAVGGEVIEVVLLGANDEAIVAGHTGAPQNWPTTEGAFLENGDVFSSRGAFVTRLTSDGSSLVFSTLIAGGFSTYLENAAVDPTTDEVVVVGYTHASDFPTTPETLFPDPIGGINGIDGFVTKLTVGGGGLVSSTYLGGFDAATESLVDVCIDGSGLITVGGASNALDLPITHGEPPADVPGLNGYLARLSPAMDRLLFSTYFDPQSVLEVESLPDGQVAFCGWTNMSDFPTTSDAPQPDYGGGSRDAWIAILDPVHEGVERYGQSTDSCLGRVAIGTVPAPVAGDADFLIFSSSAPPSTVGLLVVGFVPSDVGVPLIGATLHISPVPTPLLVPVTTGANGYMELPHPLEADWAGLTLYEQFLWLNPLGCGATGFLSASDALEIVVLPGN